MYEYYRGFAANRQKATFRDLLARVDALPRDIDLNAWIRSELSRRGGARKHLPESLAEATIVGVGAQGWERFGLWPTLGRVSDFHLFSDGLGADVPFLCGSARERDERCRRLVEFVTDLERTRPVHMVFIYADSSNLSPELMQRLHDRGCWTVLMGLDDRHTFASWRVGDMSVGVETIAPSVDLYWTSWRTGCLAHHAVGSRAWLGGAAADPTFHRPFQVDQDIDVLFLGQAYGVRRKLISDVQSYGVRVECRGHGWGGGHLDFDELVRLFSRAKVVFGVSTVGAMDDVTIMKGRDFEVPMSGACYLTQYVEELSDFFTLGQDILCYSSAIQAADILMSLLRDEDRRRELKENALRRSLAHNTWEHRLKQMYDLILRSAKSRGAVGS